LLNAGCRHVTPNWRLHWLSNQPKNELGHSIRARVTVIFTSCFMPENDIYFEFCILATEGTTRCRGLKFFPFTYFYVVCQISLKFEGVRLKVVLLYVDLTWNGSFI
jgi:hypothetical protein